MKKLKQIVEDMQKDNLLSFKNKGYIELNLDKLNEEQIIKGSVVYMELNSILEEKKSNIWYQIRK